MKLFKILSGLAILVVIFLIFIAVKSGLFKPVTWRDAKDLGPFSVLYMEHWGPYHQIIDDLQKVERWVQAQNKTCLQTYAEFLDDPQTTEHARMRSHVGCLVDQKFAGIPDDFKQKIVPKRKYLQAFFQGSPAIGPLKVYSGLTGQIETRKLKFLGAPVELYTEGPPFETEYLFPVEELNSAN